MRWLKQAVVRGFQILFEWLGRDVTDNLPPGDVLVIAPHPDDETLGCGALIARLAGSGRKVRIVLATDGSKSANSKSIGPAQLSDIRYEELKQAMRRLGVRAEDVLFLGFPDGAADQHSGPMAGKLAEAVRQAAPGLILMPSGRDKTPDHRAVAGAVEQALAATRFKGVVYEYPIWFWPVCAMQTMLEIAPLRTLRKVRTAGFLTVKQEAIAAHRSQFENLTGEPEWKTLDDAFKIRFLRPYEIFFEKEKP